MLRSSHRLFLAAVVALVSFVGASSAKAASFSTLLTPFTGDYIEVLVTIDDLGGSGDIKFTLSTQPTPGDIVGFYFNINDLSLLDGLSATGQDGTPITAFDKSGDANGVGGAYNNMNGAGNIHVQWDAGVAIGSQGGGPGDFFPVASFLLSHDTEALSLTHFEFVKMGARVQSIGENGQGSSKLVGETGAAPEPVTAALALMGLGALGVATRRRRSA